jgi:hypothetical protein
MTLADSGGLGRRHEGSRGLVGPAWVVSCTPYARLRAALGPWSVDMGTAGSCGSSYRLVVLVLRQSAEVPARSDRR